MNAEEFEFILNKVAPLITKKDTKWRLAITAKERLALTLRFLATGLLLILKLLCTFAGA